MILLFTSNHCTWCDLVKSMLNNEKVNLGNLTPIYEVNVEKHHHIAEAYGILAVPTLVAGGRILSGVPCSTDLRSFLLHAMSGSTIDFRESRISSMLNQARYQRLSTNPSTRLEKIHHDQSKLKATNIAKK